MAATKNVWHQDAAVPAAEQYPDPLPSIWEIDNGVPIPREIHRDRDRCPERANENF